MHGQFSCEFDIGGAYGIEAHSSSGFHRNLFLPPFSSVAMFLDTVIGLKNFILSRKKAFIGC